MFGLGPAELIVIVIAGLLIFGPDKLPKVAADVGRVLRQMRRMADDVRNDLKDELGDSIGDLDLKSFTPRGLVQKHLLDPALDEVEGVKRTVRGATEEMRELRPTSLLKGGIGGLRRGRARDAEGDRARPHALRLRRDLTLPPGSHAGRAP